MFRLCADLVDELVEKDVEYINITSVMEIIKILTT